MLTTAHQCAHPPVRRGMTLLELLISLVLVGLMGGLIVGFLLKQERFYAGANEILQTRTQVRQASVMMPSDLRAISPAEGDIYAMSDTSIDFRYYFWLFAGVILTNHQFLYRVGYVVCSACGVFISPFFYAFHLIDVVLSFPMLKAILQSVTHNLQQVRSIIKS